MAGVFANAVAGAKSKVAQATAAAAPPTQQFSTEPFQCEGIDKAHWAYACFCPFCAAAHAKSKADKTNPVFNVFCFLPVGAYSYVRHTYGILGKCGDDLLYGCLCAPCGTRQLYTEASTLGAAPAFATADEKRDARWTTKLFECTGGCADCCFAAACPCVVAHKTRVLLQPQTEKDEWFDYFCMLPCAMYGQVRHTVGVQSTWPHETCEDLAIGTFFYPCALMQASREATLWQAKNAGGTVLSKVAEGAAGAMGSLKSMVKMK